mgnify:CR=1 FL=1
MVKKGLLLIPGLTISMAVFAAGAKDVVDVYGLNKSDANKILKKYSKEIAEIEPTLMQELIKPENIKEFSATMKKILMRRYMLLQEITKKNGFLFVDFQTITYPQDDTYYTTIEIVDKQHQDRMRFVSAMPMKDSMEDKNVHKKPHQPDLIETMRNYSNMSVKMVMRHELSYKVKCPVYHCVAGFDHPKLKPYLDIFNKGAINEKKLIIETLRHDKDSERRAAAAFLVGHFKDPHEIISVLEPSVKDKNEGVRNNVMRVIAETMRNAKINDINVMPFLNALDSPYTVDRNKALFVLMSAANSPTSKKVILQKGGDKLLSLMELKQPNNHESAYIILKRISGKDFGYNNVAAWKNWVQSQVA